MSPDRSNITVKSRLVGGLFGMLIGHAAWAVSVLAALACPGPIFTPIAFPITYFAHLLVWPNELALPWLSWWVDSDKSNVTFGLCFYGLIGAIAGACIGHYPKGRFSLRTLLIATTLVAVGLGLIAWLSR